LYKKKKKKASTKGERGRENYNIKHKKWVNNIANTQRNQQVQCKKILKLQGMDQKFGPVHMSLGSVAKKKATPLGGLMWQNKVAPCTTPQSTCDQSNIYIHGPIEERGPR